MLQGMLTQGTFELVTPQQWDVAFSFSHDFAGRTGPQDPPKANPSPCSSPPASQEQPKGSRELEPLQLRRQRKHQPHSTTLDTCLQPQQGPAWGHPHHFHPAQTLCCKLSQPLHPLQLGLVSREQWGGFERDPVAVTTPQKPISALSRHRTTPTSVCPHQALAGGMCWSPTAHPSPCTHHMG